MKPVRRSFRSPLLWLPFVGMLALLDMCGGGSLPPPTDAGPYDDGGPEAAAEIQLDHRPA